MILSGSHGHCATTLFSFPGFMHMNPTPSLLVCSLVPILPFLFTFLNLQGGVPDPRHQRARAPPRLIKHPLVQPEEGNHLTAKQLGRGEFWRNQCGGACLMEDKGLFQADADVIARLHTSHGRYSTTQLSRRIGFKSYDSHEFCMMEVSPLKSLSGGSRRGRIGDNPNF